MKLRTMDPIKDYKFLARLEYERGNCRGDIIAKARTLNMPWRTLLLFVEETGFPPDSLREERKVVLMAAATLEQGEPYPDPRAKPRKVSTYVGGY